MGAAESGTMIRGTLIMGLESPKKAQNKVLGNKVHEGPQLPFLLEERKGLKEAQRAAHSHPPRTPRDDLRLARGSLSGPLDNFRLARGWWIYPRVGDSSSSLSRAPLGTLDRATHLRLARGKRIYPRAGDSSPPRSRPPLGTRDKPPRRLTTRRTEALKASHSATMPRTDGVRLPLPQWM